MFISCACLKEHEQLHVYVHAGNNQTTSAAIVIAGAQRSISVIALVIPVGIVVVAAPAASLLWMRHPYVPMQQ